MGAELGEKEPGGVGESGGWGSRKRVGLGEGRSREGGGPRTAQESRRTRGGEDLQRRNGRTHLSLGPRLTGLALQAQRAAVTKRSRGQPPLPALPQVARSPSRLSLQGGRPPPGHPAERTTCQTRGGGGGDAEQGWGWLGIGALGLTTPPRGPVFPGEPWRKRGVRGLASYPLHGVPHLTFCHTPLSNSASPTRPEPCDLQVWRLRKDLRPADPTSPVLGPLSQVFPSPIWYLVSFDARQALGPWNSRGALLPLRALRRKETKGINGVGGLDMMPCPPQLACTHLPSLRARLPHWTPLALVTLKWKEKVTPSAALSRCSLASGPDTAWSGCPPFLLSLAGGPLLHLADQQRKFSQAVPGEASHRLGCMEQVLYLAVPAAAEAPGEGPLCQALTFCPMMP